VQGVILFLIMFFRYLSEEGSELIREKKRKLGLEAN